VARVGPTVRLRRDHRCTWSAGVPDPQRGMRGVYDPLGVDPREVGLGYGEMLVKAATGAAMLFVAVTVLLGVVLLTAVAVLDLLERVTTLDRLRRTEADHRDDVGRSEPDRHEDRSPGDAARDRTEPPLITGWKIVLVPLVALGVTVFLRWAFTAYPRPAGFGVFLLLATLSFIGLIRILSAADPAVAIRRLGGGESGSWRANRCAHCRRPAHVLRGPPKQSRSRRREGIGAHGHANAMARRGRSGDVERRCRQSPRAARVRSVPRRGEQQGCPLRGRGGSSAGNAFAGC
jgi:hypothetical protein